MWTFEIDDKIIPLIGVKLPLLYAQLLYYSNSTGNEVAGKPYWEGLTVYTTDADALKIFRHDTINYKRDGILRRGNKEYAVIGMFPTSITYAENSPYEITLCIDKFEPIVQREDACGQFLFNWA